MKAREGLWHNRAILSAAELVLDGKLSELQRLATATAEFSRRHSLGEETAYDLNLALEELFVNALKHGGCEGMKAAVRIRFETSEREVRMEFADRGWPFDPTSVADTGGGLGLHLVRQVMCEIHYRRDGVWNRVTMRQAGGAR